LHSRGLFACARSGCIRAVRCAARDAMRGQVRCELVSFAGAGGAMLLTMVSLTL
jgi:hypothetical protein